MLSVFDAVAMKSIMLSVIMLCVVLLNVVAPKMFYHIVLKQSERKRGGKQVELLPFKSQGKKFQN